ncbi:TonB-dependent receptor [Parashewanella tropica]|uniref:TonB-dependent receptor n=1 Tax=Parashewanella tropica TaxID=2547970 RepID=UPI0014786143|nr:TonB-dependent receptor [Parashewanella tropica]
MTSNRKLLIGATLISLGFTPSLIAQEVSNTIAEQREESQKKANKKNDDVERIQVSGIKSALESGLRDKRESNQVVDVIVAEDIGKFSDSNIAETLQRLPGIQIGRSQTGEGSEISIRGLGRSITTMNGRTMFTGIGRNINVKDIPSESLSGIKVYKSPQANQIEGGIAGTLDLQRVKTTNFNNQKGSINVQAQYADLSEKWAPKISGMVGDSFDTEYGEFGALLAFNHQTRNTRFDRQRTLPFTVDIAGGKDGAKRSAGGGFVYGTEETKRNNIVARLDWDPNEDSHYFLDFGYIDFSEDTRRNALNYKFGTKVKEASFDNPNLDVTKITFTNPTMQSLSQIEERETKTYDIALGAEYFIGDFTLELQASYVSSESDNTFTNLRLTDTNKADEITVDYSGANSSAPNVSVPTNINQKSYFAIDQFRDQITKTKSDETAFRADLTYDINGDFFQSVETGFRYTVRDAERSGFDLLKRGSKKKPFKFGIEGSELDHLFMLSDSDFYDGEAGLPSGFVIGDMDGIRGEDALVRSTLGLKATSEAPANNLRFDITEKTLAAYVQANFESEIGSVPYSGNFGLRMVDTKRDGEGLILNKDNEYVPSNSENDETTFLPSVNVKFEVSDDVLIRFAASRVMSQPNFADLAPGVRLNYGNNTANAGNPDLKAFTADNFDIGVEWYVNDSTALTGTFFYKEVDGFLVKVSENETFFGEEFLTTRRVNGEKGKLKGFAASYQQFFDFLPGIWQNFGLKANATFIDSEAPSPIEGLDLPLQDLSKSSYNLAGIYEDDKFSARLTWNWREKYFDSIVAGKPLFNSGGGVLDASFNYKLTKKFKVKLSLKNINNKEVHTYYQDEYRPRDFAINDRRAVLGVTYKF